MQSNASFSGLSLTQMFEIQAIQSLLIKFWYLGLNSDCLVGKQDDASAFKNHYASVEATLKPNSKTGIKQLNPPQQDEQIKFCVFCNKRAQFECGICQQATYCTTEHQKADWPSHKRRCIKREDKLKQLNKHLQNEKKQFFDKLSKKLTTECQKICDNILKISEQIVTKFPSPKHQIQYGTAICCYVKMLLAVKSFNDAQEILNNYLREKDSFLRDISDIPSKLKPEDPNYNSILTYVDGKLKLISVLCNLTHQAVRNSVYMIQILLKHCQKFYGHDSLQVSNVYFQLGNYYYYFMNQNMKACACYLVAGQIRKQKGVGSFYNAAIILMQTNNYAKAIKFLLKCLDMVQKNGDYKSIIDRIYLALAYCYKKINSFDNTVHYLQRALCQISVKKRFNNVEQVYIKDLLKYLSEEYKKQFSNDQIISLPREKHTVQPQVTISNTNFEDFWDLDVDNTKKKKADEWIKSFKNQTQKTKFESKIPMTNNLIQKVLFINNFTDDKNEQSVAPTNKSNSATDYINVDYEFMSKLTSTQVRFMNELNRLLLINKDKPTLYDVIESSNLIQELSKQKLQRFYQLNPQLIRQKQDYNIMDDDQSVPSMDPSSKTQNNASTKKTNEVNKGSKPPKLDLSKTVQK